MLRPLSFTVPAAPDKENEDAIAVGDGVVVDGAGLPAHLRAGCRHSVAWFAESIARAFHDRLARRSGSMRAALAEAITLVADSHASTCDLAGGSPSATVAAWRLGGAGQLEYLVLCGASLVLVDRRGRATEITGRRLQEVMAVAASPDASREAFVARRRATVEASRNRPGGFWCVHTDPSAAAHALRGEVLVTDLAGVVACGDGAARAYELLGTHTLAEFSLQTLRGHLRALAGDVRDAEEHQAEGLHRQGLKVHDDLTIVATVLTDTIHQPIPEERA